MFLEKLTPIIIYEDHNIIIINKPSGMVVNKSDNSPNNTLQDYLISHIFNNDSQLINFTKDSSDFYKRAGIVHRLDKDTSGIIIVAKNEEAFFYLQKQFLEKNVEKTYLALVHGRVDKKEGVIQNKVGRIPKARRKFGVLSEGRVAITNYKVINYYKKDNEQFTLLEVFPKTGRTHQIRIHMKHIGHSIVSDPLYAGRKVYRADKKILSQMFLHAQKIRFEDFTEKKKVSFEAELPVLLTNFLNSLEITP